MRDFQQRKKVRRALYSRTSIVILAVITVFLLRGAIGVLKKDSESRKDLALAQNELSTAEAKSQELSESVSLLSTETGVENEIRQKFSVSKDGEQVAVIVDSPTVATSSSSAPEGFWARLVAWFRSIF